MAPSVIIGEQAARASPVSAGSDRLVAEIAKTLAFLLSEGGGCITR